MPIDYSHQHLSTSVMQANAVHTPILPPDGTVNIRVIQTAFDASDDWWVTPGGLIVAELVEGDIVLDVWISVLERVLIGEVEETANVYVGPDVFAVGTALFQSGSVQLAADNQTAPPGILWRTGVPGQGFAPAALSIDGIAEGASRLVPFHVTAAIQIALFPDSGIPPLSGSGTVSVLVATPST